MRIIRITTNYINYLEQFYSRNAELKFQDYDNQYSILMSDCFGWANFWTLNLKKLGYEVWETIGNAEYLQKKWAEENSFIFSNDNWVKEIISAQVKKYKPDILFVNDYLTYDFNFINYLKLTYPNIKLVLGWCGAPYNDCKVFYSYDVVLSNIPNHVEEFKKMGLKAEYFPHAFEPSILDKINLKNNFKYPFTFSGSIVGGEGFHNIRKKLLLDLVKHTNLKIWSDFSNNKNSMSLKSNIIKILSKNFNLERIASLIKPEINKSVEDFKITNLISKRTKQAVYGLEMFQLLRDSNITLNNHIDLSSDYASNMRMFEATGVGTCLVTDWKKNIKEFFEPDYEIVTYKSIDELINKTKYLENNVSERNKIANAGQKRTLKDHTFKNRSLILDEIIKKYM